MNTRRTGISILLAGVLTVFCLASNSLAAPRASSQAAQPAPQSSDPSRADIEAALKTHMETEQKLLSRIHDLENAQRKLVEQFEFALVSTNDSETVQKLQSRIRDLENALENQKKQIKQPQSDASPNWILGGAAFFTLALCVIFLLRMHRPKSLDEAWPQENPTSAAKTSSHSTSLIPPAPATETDAESPPAHSSVSPLPDWDSASPALDLQSLNALVAEGDVRDRDSTIELAEIMLSFGRINSAAEALANFIENNPKEAFVPWLKLLEVYKNNGQRTEFDKIAKKLNKTFNVWTVDWNNFNDALAPVHGIETMTHIAGRLQDLWGTRECQAYLQYLLRDTRDETRRGFPLAAIDDILCLNDILEYCLGPYTGPLSNFDYAPTLDTSPPTETEGDKTDSQASADDAKQDVGEPQTGKDKQEEVQLY